MSEHPTPLRRRCHRLFQAAVVAYWLSMFWATHAPRVEVVEQLPATDKQLHFSGYFVLGLLVSEAWFGWATEEELQPNIDGSRQTAAGESPNIYLTATIRGAITLFDTITLSGVISFTASTGQVRIAAAVT